MTGVTFNDRFQSTLVTITGIVKTDLFPLVIVHIPFHDSLEVPLR